MPKQLSRGTRIAMARKARGIWRKARGICQSCNRKLGVYAWHCDRCARKRQRREGSKPWKKGRPGRPPISLGGAS